MDGFGDNFDQADVDPAAEFLAREQNELAGLEDELSSAPPTGAIPVITNGTASGVQTVLDSEGSFEVLSWIDEQATNSSESFDQLLPDQDPFGIPQPQDPFSQSQDQDPFSSFGQQKTETGEDPFAVIDQSATLSSDENDLFGQVSSTLDQVEVRVEPAQDGIHSNKESEISAGDVPSENQLASGDAADEASVKGSQSQTSSPAPHRPTPVREEPEKIKKWREEQKQRLEEKDANEETKKEEWREAAKKELEEWYRHHEDLISKTRAANRNAEKQFVADDDEIEPGTEWERIAKLCDFNPKASKGSKDVSRMRSIILQLKQNPLPVNGFGNKRS